MQHTPKPQIVKSFSTANAQGDDLDSFVQLGTALNGVLLNCAKAYGERLERESGGKK